MRWENSGANVTIKVENDSGGMFIRNDSSTLFLIVIPFLSFPTAIDKVEIRGCFNGINCIPNCPLNLLKWGI
jgi:hypothetical protein